MLRTVVLAVAVLVLSAPVAQAAGPVQSGTTLHPQRAAILDNIRGSLPNIGAQWSVYCTRNSPQMRCWARNPRARYVRRYLAAVQHGGWSLVAVPPWRLGNLKHGIRVDGLRG